MEKKIDQIIEKYYSRGSKAHRIYYDHCLAVTRLALKIAEFKPELGADIELLEYGGMLHDIGIFLTDAPDIECYGSLPYLAHGYLGRELLEKEGLKEVAPVCERHIGVGISLDEIIRNRLPLPYRDMTPQTIEEKIICYADKFYSKTSVNLSLAKSMDRIRKSITKYGDDKWERFSKLDLLFGPWQKLRNLG